MTSSLLCVLERLLDYKPCPDLAVRLDHVLDRFCVNILDESPGPTLLPQGVSIIRADEAYRRERHGSLDFVLHRSGDETVVEILAYGLRLNAVARLVNYLRQEYR
jgi:hypothetical protein